MNTINRIGHFTPKITQVRSNERADGVTVGLTRAMTFYEHGRLWQNFFTMLGCSVLVSQQTNQRIMDAGVAHCSNETCLPVKVLTGHVLELAGKCDTIFIPRYKSTARHELCCPKLCGLPDMVRLSLREKVDILEITVDVDKDDTETNKSLEALARRIGVSYSDVQNTYRRAVKNRLNFDVKARLSADMEIGTLIPEKTVAVLGHPYMIYDRFLSMNLIGKLRAAGMAVVTPDSFSHRARIDNAYPYFDRRNFYAIGSDNLGCAYLCAQRMQVAGLVYLTPFACGIDSLTTEFIARHLKQRRPLPMLVQTVDEHTGEAGFDTRLEAFLDMLNAYGGAARG